MLTNLSNHISKLWGERQLLAAIEKYGSIVDLEFPQIPPTATIAEVSQLAKIYLEKILVLKESDSRNNKFAVHIMGELTFVYALLDLLKEHKIKAIASTTQRNTQMRADGSKISEFKFIKFREYY